MRIALIVYGSLHALTGGYLYDRRMMDFLRGRGHGIEVVSLPVRGYPLRLTDNFSRALIERMRRKRFDILIQDELCHPSLGLFNRRLRRHFTAPIVAVVHHLFCAEARPRLFNFFLALPEKGYLGSVDAFIFNSRTTRDSVLALSSNAKPFVVAPPGGDRFKHTAVEDRIEQRAARDGPLRLLFVGLAIPRKGLGPLLNALSRVPRSLWRLDVVGDANRDPSYVRRIRAQAASCALEQNIAWWGALSQEALAEKLAEADLLCMPFAYEGFGIATLEALHFGLPVLGSRYGATCELIRHGWNGMLFGDNEVQAVADEIQHLHQDRNRLAAMSLAALQSSRKRPTWQQSMAVVEAFLVELIRKFSSTPECRNRSGF